MHHSNRTVRSGNCLQTGKAVSRHCIAVCNLRILAFRMIFQSIPQEEEQRARLFLSAVCGILDHKAVPGNVRVIIGILHLYNVPGMGASRIAGRSRYDAAVDTVFHTHPVKQCSKALANGLVVMQCTIGCIFCLIIGIFKVIVVVRNVICNPAIDPEHLFLVRKPGQIQRAVNVLEACRNLILLCQIGVVVHSIGVGQLNEFASGSIA